MPAIVAQDYRTKELSLVVRPLEGKYSEYPLASSSTAGIEISWARETVFVSSEDGSWKLEPNGTALIRIEPGAVPADLAEARQMKLAEKSRLGLGPTDHVDCWCVSCALRFLPRSERPGR
jgi:hypothetical protein